MHFTKPCKYKSDLAALNNAEAFLVTLFYFYGYDCVCGTAAGNGPFVRPSDAT
jgi:hypothetical protein